MGNGVFFERVLLVEDDSSHTLLIKRALKTFAGEILHAPTVAAALSIASKGGLDLIVCDLHLPDAQGTEHVKKLKEHRPETPLIVLTSSTTISEAVDAMKSGASDFITKNFDASFADALGLSLSRVHESARLARERAKLEREMVALRTAIENSSDGLAVIDGSGGVEYSNSAFRDFVSRCGGDPSQISKLFGAVVLKHEALLSEIVKKCKELPIGAVWHSEVGFVGKKDSALSLGLSAIRSSQSGDNELVLWVRDISDEKKRERFQREILSTTTHDLKGPLGAILISAELLAPMLSEQKRASEIVLRMASSAQGAVNLIDELLSARRIQEGTLILRPSVQSLRALVDESVAAFAPVAGARSITLQSSGDKAIEAKVDKLGIERVVGNLVSNALKFTPKGGSVTVSISENGDEVHIQVADTGSGMEPAEVGKLFERFSRLEKHREVPGTGLGLFVVRSIVSAHGGQINVTSKVGQGTTFDITLPKMPPVNDRGELISVNFG